MTDTLEIDPTFPSPEAASVRLWWLGQAGFAIRSGRSLLLVDPYLTDTLHTKYRDTRFPHVRMSPPPVEAASIRGVTAVLCTHGHTDHMDPGTIAELEHGNDPLYVIPRSETTKGVERGIRPHRLLGLDAGEAATLSDGITIHAVPAAHEHLGVDDSGQHLYLGYVIEIDGLRIYHSGDCVPYPGQAEVLAKLDVHVALLPVNGRDLDRASNGVPGNFHLAEALSLCRAARIPRLVCHHWGLFDFNTVDPDDLRTKLETVSDIDWIVPHLGGSYPLARPNEAS